MTEHVTARRLPLTLRPLDLILRRIQSGRLEVIWPDGQAGAYGDDQAPLRATLIVRDRAVVRRVLLGGSLGFAEGYLDGQWDTPDLPALLELLAANLQSGALARKPVPLQPLRRIGHLARANTRAGARRNIRYHYDLGNDFYRPWLDPTMTYSCALFPEEEDDPPSPPDLVTALANGQIAKWESILDMIHPAPGSHLLEIGCGWGGFAIHAAQTRGCTVTGITLSLEQLEYARAAAGAAGIDDRVEFRLQDYRDISETFNHVVSIEMFEAVGERYWPVFFDTLRKVMRPGGRAALQVITIAEERFEAYRRRTDFTQAYIFPGGMLPSPQAFARAARRSGFHLGEPRLMAPSYARTLAFWLGRFDDAADDVRSLGFDERFIRMWRYYLAYCIAGFRQRMVDVMQVALT